MLFQTPSSSHLQLLRPLIKIMRVPALVFICITIFCLQLVQPSPALCNIPLSTPESLPAVSESAPPKQTSFMHMQGFFKNVTQYFGTRYRSGGQTPAGFDCSGFVRFMYEKVFNIDLPRSSREMSALGSKVLKDELQPGDLVFFHSKNRRINHVGIFIGNDTFIHSSLTKGITEDQLKYNYYEKRFAGAVRLLELPRSQLPAPTAPQEVSREQTKPS